MAFKPNYGRDRAERARAARTRSEEKQRKKDEKAALSFAQRSLLVLLSLFLFASRPCRSRSFSSISSVVWLECHWDDPLVRPVDFVPSWPYIWCVRGFACLCYWSARALPETTLNSDAGLCDVVQPIDADRRFRGRPDMAQGTVK